MARGKLKNKRKPNISKALTESSISVFLSMIEIHNKPKIEYRYPTAVILMINSWELLFKAYIHKYINPKKLWKENGFTITLSEAINVIKVSEYTLFNKQDFAIIHSNVESLEKYRNEYIHYNLGVLDPVIFGLLYKSSLLYSNFLAKTFKKDISILENLIIMPIGLKLPYDPISFLKLDECNSNDFYVFLINKTKELLNNGINESIFVSLDVKFESVKKIQNSDIVVGLDSAASNKVAMVKNVRISNDPGAQSVYFSDNAILIEFPLTHEKLVERVRERVPDFKLNSVFYKILKDIKLDTSIAYERKLNPLTKKTSRTFFYKVSAVDFIVKKYSSII